MAAKRATLRVRDVFDLDRSLAIIVPADTPFRDVVRSFSERQDLRGIFVVDDKQHLSGVITRNDLLHWASANLDLDIPGDEHSWRDMYRVMSAVTAQEACFRNSKECHVHPDDALESALGLMLEHSLIDIPVLDDEGNIIGDIRLTEVLGKVFEVNED